MKRWLESKTTCYKRNSARNDMLVFCNKLESLVSYYINNNVTVEQYCRTSVWIRRNRVTLARWTGRFTWWPEGAGATCRISARFSQVGAYLETLTLVLSNLQPSTSLHFYLSTRRAVMGMCMIHSQSQGTIRMSWLVYMMDVNPPLWLDRRTKEIGK